MTEQQAVQDAYRQALIGYLQSGDEAMLLRAQDCGWQALASGLSTLDLVALHRTAIRSSPFGAHLDEGAERTAALAEAFLSQSLVPFDMARRGFVEASAGLQEANATLEQRVGVRTQVVEKLNEALEQRILERTQALQSNEQRFRLLAENAQDVIFRIQRRPVLHMDYISRACETICGYSRETFYADPYLFYKHVHPDDYRLVDPAAKPGEDLKTIRWLRQDGSLIWLEIRAKAVRNEAGEAVAVEGIARDVTERQKMQDQLRAHALQQATIGGLGQLALTGGNLPELLDNVAFMVGRIFGVEFTGVLELLPDKSALLLRAGAGWKAGMVGEATTPADNNSLAGYTLTAGRPVIVEDMRTERRFRPSPMTEEHNIVSGVTVVIRGVRRIIGVLGALTARRRTFTDDEVNFLLAIADVLGTAMERKEAESEIQGLNESLERRVLLRTEQLEGANRELEAREQALQLAKEEADRANHAKSEFLSRMSHELRTPLNSILGFSELLEMDELSADQQESLGFITRAGRHLLDLINEVLDIARVEADRLALSPEPVAISAVIREVLDLVRPLAQERNVSLELPASEPPEPVVLADLQRLKQVLLNLVSNAIKYNRQGGHVWVEWTERPEGWLRVGVRDTGPGIAPEKLGKLFSPFERLGAEQTDVEGTGLGLSLSKRLVEAMNGTIGVESTLGEGSYFWFEFPIAAGLAERIEALKAAAEPVSAKEPATNRT